MQGHRREQADGSSEVEPRGLGQASVQQHPGFGDTIAPGINRSGGNGVRASDQVGR